MGYSNKKACRVIRRCGRCGKKTAFTSTRRFRVNASGNKLDVWLIYRCERCRHTLKVPIYERVSPRKIPPELYEKFLANDEELAARYGADAPWLKSRNFFVET